MGRQRIIDRNAGKVVGEKWDTLVFQQQQHRKQKGEFRFVYERIRSVAQQN